MAQLVMFDVDGTLTRSIRADGVCYAQAMSEYLDMEIDTDWSAYRHSTDSGIAQELFARAGRPPPTTRDIERIRRRLLGLLADALRADPCECAPVSGAGSLIERLRTTPEVNVSIATGAWEDSARLKLRHAELPVSDLPFASGDDAAAREEIMTISLQRALQQAGVSAFDHVTYVGDQIWDVVAAQTLGFDFVGVAVGVGADSLRTAGAEVVVRDFTSAERISFTS